MQTVLTANGGRERGIPHNFMKMCAIASVYTVASTDELIDGLID